MVHWYTECRQRTKWAVTTGSCRTHVYTYAVDHMRCACHGLYVVFMQWVLQWATVLHAADHMETGD